MKPADPKLWLSTEWVECCLCFEPIELCKIDDKGWDVVQCYCARARDTNWCYFQKGNAYCNKCCVAENIKQKEEFYTRLPADEWKQHVSCNHSWKRKLAGQKTSAIALQDASTGIVTRVMALSHRPADVPPRCASLSAGSSSTDHKPSQFDANTPSPDIVYEQIAELRKTAEDTKRTLQNLRTDLNDIVPQMQEAISDLRRQVKRLQATQTV